MGRKFSMLLALLVIGLTYNLALADWTDFLTDGDEPGLWVPPPEMEYGSKVKATREALLAPGMGTFCEKKFIVQNMGNEFAELELIFGGKQTNEEIQPKAVMSYNLMGQTGAKNEARIVNSGDSPIKVECK